MRVALITEFGLNERHGTGSQLLRLYHQFPMPFHHFQMFMGDHGPSDITNSTYLNANWWPFRRGKRLINRTLCQIGIGWWDGQTLNRRRALRAISRIGSSFDVAHVVVGHEENASFAVQLLSLLKAPYVLQVWDLYHPEGLVPDKMPGWSRLIRGASTVLALNGPIELELAKFSPRCLERLQVGRGPAKHAAVPPKSGESLRIVIAGRPHAKGLDFLASQLPYLTKRWRSLRIVYCGPSAGTIPQAMQPYTDMIGFVQGQDEYDRLLASCHIGFLTGPCEMNSFGRFSFPSRTADYFMVGLPVIAYVDRRSATSQMLSPAAPQGVRLIEDGTELTQAIDAFSCSPESWQFASVAAKNFGEANFSLGEIRDRLVVELQRAGEAGSWDGFKPQGFNSSDIGRSLTPI